GRHVRGDALPLARLRAARPQPRPRSREEGGRVTMFVVERRMPNLSGADLALLQEALVFACDRLTSRGEPVRCLGSAFLPDQARLLTLFEAETAEVVRKVNESVHRAACLCPRSGDRAVRRGCQRPPALHADLHGCSFGTSRQPAAHNRSGRWLASSLPRQAART